MKQARFDVFKFGIKGFDKEGQLSAREALAIRLGAKPAKNKCLPYHELKAKRREEREVERAAKEEQNKTQLKTAARAAPPTKKKDKRVRRATSGGGSKKSSGKGGGKRGGDVFRTMTGLMPAAVADFI